MKGSSAVCIIIAFISFVVSQNVESNTISANVAISAQIEESNMIKFAPQKETQSELYKTGTFDINKDLIEYVGIAKSKVKGFKLPRPLKSKANSSKHTYDSEKLGPKKLEITADSTRKTEPENPSNNLALL